MAAAARGEEEGGYKREGELEERKRTREKEEPGARKTNGEGGHLRKTEERHHLIPPSYLCISKREFVCVRTYSHPRKSLYAICVKKYAIFISTKRTIQLSFISSASQTA